ncbi:hypothetical protein CEXT_204651 [Caerostris extrusa]|uniref:Ycf15 n=1 Tax=Caerostris extrusa TaxID=172846 RepID=A0AAV4MRV6_CAEEX|nr:hypothetical protein CEXT_204651 [Caerostris extrusa]
MHQSIFIAQNDQQENLLRSSKVRTRDTENFLCSGNYPPSNSSLFGKGRICMAVRNPPRRLGNFVPLRMEGVRAIHHRHTRGWSQISKKERAESNTIE